MVVIVGAGASFDYGLPVGDKLRHIIAEACSDDPKRVTDPLRDAAQHLAATHGHVDIDELNKNLNAIGRIGRGLPHAKSIDNFLRQNESDKRLVSLGKIAIARAILDAEASSKLRIGPRSKRFNQSFVAQYWINAFFQILTEDCEFEDLPERFRSTTFVIFNYDRCVEHSIYQTIQDAYGVTDKEAQEAIQHLTFLHPYGAVGDLPWQSDRGVPFGAQLDTRGLVEIGQGLFTFTEGVALPDSDMAKIRSAMHEAERYIYLGFAFYRQNMEVLYKDVRIEPYRQVYGTTYLMSKSDQESVFYELQKIHKSDAFLSAVECPALFREYSRRITFDGVPRRAKV